MPISVTAYVICFLHPCVVMHLALVKSELLKCISESLYPFEFQINKLIKYFKEKKKSFKNNYTYGQHYYPDCEIYRKCDISCTSYKVLGLVLKSQIASQFIL